jgi:putative transposase
MAGENLPVQLATRVLRVSESGYYVWKSRTPSVRSLRHAWLTEQITAIHTASHGIYGARRVHAELVLGHGVRLGHGQVERLMNRAGLKGLPGNKRRRPKPEVPTAADLVDRNFARTGRDQLWVTDITEHPTREGKVYCAVVLDTHSRRVVGWSIDATQTAALVRAPCPWPSPTDIRPHHRARSSTPITACNSPPGPSPSAPATRGWCPRWARSGTATTTP